MKYSLFLVLLFSLSIVSCKKTAKGSLSLEDHVKAIHQHLNQEGVSGELKRKRLQEFALLRRKYLMPSRAQRFIMNQTLPMGLDKRPDNYQGPEGKKKSGSGFRFRPPLIKKNQASKD